MSLGNTNITRRATLIPFDYSQWDSASCGKLRKFPKLPDFDDASGAAYAEKMRNFLEMHMRPILKYCRRYYSDLKAMIATGNAEHDQTAEQAIMTIIAEKKQFITNELLELTNLYRAKEKVSAYYDDQIIIGYHDYFTELSDIGPEWFKINTPMLDHLLLMQGFLTPVRDKFAELGFMSPTFMGAAAERQRAFQSKSEQITAKAGINFNTLELLLDERSALIGENQEMLSFHFFNRDRLKKNMLRELVLDEKYFSCEIYCSVSFPYDRWLPGAGGLGHPSEAQALYTRKILHPIVQETFINAFSRTFPEINRDRIYVPKIPKIFETEKEMEIRMEGYREEYRRNVLGQASSAPPHEL